MDFSNISGIRTTEDLARSRAANESELDRNAFLKLFTTQLQNQNPLDPVKNEAFIAQLAQFSTLEATSSMSDSLDRFVNDQRSETLMRGASLIGKNVFTENGSFHQNGGEEIEGFMEIAFPADEVILSVHNAETGEIVNRFQLGPQSDGEIPFIWNGGDLNGKAAEKGVYAFSAIAMRGSGKQTVSTFAPTEVKGVSWDQLSGGAFLDLADGYTLPLASVKRISD